MRFSIITPSFNQGPFIQQTIESILSQEGDFEVEAIVMDGGSTDTTVMVLEEIARKVKDGHFAGLNSGVTFTWTSKKDKGQSDAINQGLRQATGDILAYLNSDDFYQPHALSQVAQAFTTHPQADWLYGRCQIVDENNCVIRRPITWWKNITGWRYSYTGLLILNYIPQPATFWRRRVYEAIGGFREDEHLVMDYAYWCQAGKRFCGHHVRQYLAGFRVHATSKGGNLFRQQFADGYRIATQFTKNPLILGLHHWHDKLNISIYAYLDKVK